MQRLTTDIVQRVYLAPLRGEQQTGLEKPAPAADERGILGKPG